MFMRKGRQGKHRIFSNFKKETKCDVPLLKILVGILYLHLCICSMNERRFADTKFFIFYMVNQAVFLDYFLVN